VANSHEPVVCDNPNDKQTLRFLGGNEDVAFEV